MADRQPIIGVCMTIIQDGHVLLIERGKDPLPASGKRQWALPGGKLKFGETLEQAACRETMEETGLTITPGPLLLTWDVMPHTATNPTDNHYFIVHISADLAPGCGPDQARAGDDASDLRWVPLTGLEDYQLWPNMKAAVHNALQLTNKTPPTG